MATTASGAPNVIPLPMLNNNQTGTNHDHDNNNNHVRARAYAREWQKILDAYEDVMGRPMPRFVQRECESFINSGIQPDMITAVLEYTACAPRPSWAYARTVLYRSEEKGMRCSADFMNGLASRGRAGDADVPY